MYGAFFLEVSYMMKYLKDNIQGRFFKLSLAGTDTAKTVTKAVRRLTK